MNESISDIMAAFAEHVQFPHPTNNWAIGEKVAGLLLGTKIRDMADPASVPLAAQPDNMSKYNNTTEDNGGVHINSGIPNNAAYLMTVGGTNKTSGIAVSRGIGWEKAEQLWYRVNTEYLGKTSNFADSAQATLTAAGDLGFTEAEKATIECAWIAVGVITSPSACRVVQDDGGVTEGGAPEGGGGGPTTDGGPAADGGSPDVAVDSGSRDGGADVNRADASADRGVTPDVTTTPDVATPDSTTPTPDATTVDVTMPPADATGGSGGAGGSGTGGSTTGSGGNNPGDGSGCSCRVGGAPSAPQSAAAWGGAMALVLGAVRRRRRKAA
jgi:MYXO-CTERM domain-containing protein